VFSHQTVFESQLFSIKRNELTSQFQISIVITMMSNVDNNNNTTELSDPVFITVVNPFSFSVRSYFFSGRDSECGLI
jgi:hypothetical protein